MSNLTMLEQLSAYGDYGFLALRLALASVFIYHALPKLTKPKMLAGMFGGKAYLVTLLGLLEGLSGLLVLTGFQARLGALGIILAMLGALYYKIFKWKVPFYAQDKTGWEFDIVILAGALVLLVSNYGLVLSL